MKLPIVLPDGWTHEESPALGVIITGADSRGHTGYVTVSERQRNFDLGMTTVRRRGEYAGRSWRQSLYADAVAALQAALN